MTRLVIWATPRLEVARPVLDALAGAGIEVHVVAGDRPPGEAKVDLGSTTATIEGADWAITPMRAARVPVIGRGVQLVHALIGRSRAELERRERTIAIATVVERRRRHLHPTAVVAVGPEVARAVRAAQPLIVVAVPEETADGRRLSWLAALLSSIEGATGARRAARAMARAQAVVAPDGGAELVAEIQRLPTSGPTATARPDDGSPQHRAAIVIATRDRGHLLRQSLPSVLAAAAAVPATEVIVVQQGERAPLPRDDGLVVVHDGEGRGASRARNLGVAHATAEVVLFTDDDCVVPASWVRDHLEALRDPTVVACCGEVTGLTRSGVAGDPTAHALLHRTGAMPWHVGHGSNLAVRAPALRECGGWDERLGPGTPRPAGEDADLIARLLERGGGIRSGVGEPVAHLAWRSEEDDAVNLAVYERGAGYWIGKAVRERRPMAGHYLRGRLRLHRRRATPRVRASFAAGFVRGVCLSASVEPPTAPAEPGGSDQRLETTK